jgi:hypothetical protein
MSGFEKPSVPLAPKMSVTLHLKIRILSTRTVMDVMKAITHEMICT